MKRVQSSMSATQLEAWRQRHGHSLTSGAEALGVSRRTFADYLAGSYSIPQTVALLCAALDRLTPTCRCIPGRGG
jgi:predicted transcriptional regulator